MIDGHGRPVVLPRRSAQSSEAPHPNRAVRFIVPAAPSGPTDVMARVITPGLHDRLRRAG